MSEGCSTLTKSLSNLITAYELAEATFRTAQKEGGEYFEQLEKVLEGAQLKVQELDFLWQQSFMEIPKGRKIFIPNYEALERYLLDNSVGRSSHSELTIKDLTRNIGLDDAGRIIKMTLYDSPVNIQALRKLPSLKELVIPVGSVEDISPLSSLVNLGKLQIMDYKGSDIASIASLPNLKELIFTKSFVNMAKVKDVQLRKLILRETSIVNIEAIGDIPTLEDLSIGGQDIGSFLAVDSLEFLTNLQGLKRLDMSYSYVDNIGPLEKLPSLEFLDIRWTEVSDLSPLKNLTNLRGLKLDKTPVSDLGPIAGLKNLERLEAENARISDLTPLAGLSNLYFLNVSGREEINDLTPLANLTNLMELDLSNVSAEDLSPLGNLIQVGELSLQGDSPCKDFSFLAKMQSLKTVFIYLDIKALSPLLSLPNLESVYLEHDQADQWEDQKENIRSLRERGVYVKVSDET